MLRLPEMELVSNHGENLNFDQWTNPTVVYITADNINMITRRKHEIDLMPIFIAGSILGCSTFIITHCAIFLVNPRKYYCKGYGLLPGNGALWTFFLTIFFYRGDFHPEKQTPIDLCATRNFLFPYVCINEAILNGVNHRWFRTWQKVEKEIKTKIFFLVSG